MKILAKITLLLLAFFTINFEAFAYEIGILLEQKQEPTFVQTLKLGNNKIQALQITDIPLLNANNTPILLITSYKSITSSQYNAIVKYLQNDGKLILITPKSSLEEETFKKLAKLVGVNVEKFKYSQEKSDINWVEKTLEQNTIKAGAKTTIATLNDDTAHLAVFGDIEKHESAISLNAKGSVISWIWGVDGEKRFNEKSLIFLLEELLPQSNRHKNSFLHPLFNYNEDMEKLKNVKLYVENYQDNIINYATDNSIAEQNLKLAEIDEILANFYYQKGEHKDYEKHYKKALKRTYAGIFGTNNLAPAENRGIWFDRGTIVDIRTKSEMSKYFEMLKNSGINTVYFETFNAGFTIYPSKVGTQTPLIRGRDPLAWAVEEAHKRKIKIHAWMWIFAVGNDRHNKLINKPDTYEGPVLEKNKRWALLGANGNFRPKNQPEFWIDPSNKEGVAFLLKLADEVVKNYDVDGIQLDYIRYPFQSADNLMGFNHNSAEEFSVKTGEKMFTDNYQTNLLWNRWKENNVTDFVKKVSKQTKRINPNLKISASIFSKSQTNRLNSIQQNWENWLINDYVDILTPMSYSSNLKALDTNLFYLKPQIGAGLIYPGIALKHVDELAMTKQISKIREYGYSGVTLFAVAQLDEAKADFLKDGIFSQKSVDPTYAKEQSAMLLLKDYKLMLQTIKATTYNLTNKQKNNIEKMLSCTNNAIFNINNAQLNSAIEIIYELEELNEKFFSSFSTYNNLRKETATSYLKRAENLLKIAAKR